MFNIWDFFAVANTAESDGSDGPATIGSDLHAQTDIDVGEQNTRITLAASFDFHDGQLAANFALALNSDKGAVPVTVNTTSLNVDLVNETFVFKADLGLGIVPIEADSITAQQPTSHSAEPEPSQPELSQLPQPQDAEQYGSWELGIANLLHGIADLV